jgi:hypothetical protein
VEVEEPAARVRSPSVAREPTVIVKSARAIVDPRVITVIADPDDVSVA